MNYAKTMTQLQEIKLPDDLIGIYTQAGLKITTPPSIEPESTEYGACRFSIHGHNIAFRALLQIETWSKFF